MRSVGLTTGNSYTIALALEAIDRAAGERGLDSTAATLAVVGASGNIGQTCAELLAPRYGQTLLIGSSKPSQRTVNLGLGIEVTNHGLPGRLSIEVALGVHDDRGRPNDRPSGVVRATGSNTGSFEAPGRNPSKLLAKWSLTF